MGLDWKAIDEELAGLLHGLPELSVDRAQLEHFAEEIRAGRLGPESNRLSAPPEPVPPERVDRLEALPAAERARYTKLGQELLGQGGVAVAVLNGGMATRFGGVVKGIVQAISERSFLELKHTQARRHGPVPFLVMNSFATHQATLRFLKERGLEEDVLPFLQCVSLRLTPEGDLFRDASGALSPYAPGHGDFITALRTSGHLAALRKRGVRALTLSNVDNLGAELDPVIVGYHAAHGRPLTVEVAHAVPGDVGGAPASVRGRVRIVEGFCFPAGFDSDQIGFINTNTFIISLSALERDYPLSWYYVEKMVDGRKAIQMEHLIGDLSTFVDTAYLATPRSGPRGRFLPVKTPADLEALRNDPVLRKRFTGE